MTLRVLISHSHVESKLAGAWKTLLAETSQGMIDVWYSSDVTPTGGMDLGQEWRKTLDAEIAHTNFVIAILTPQSRDRPWILWECGLINGRSEQGHEAGRVVPITYSMKSSELENPLASFQIYSGDDRAKVTEVCIRLAMAAGIPSPQPKAWVASLDAYLNAIAANKPRRARNIDDMALWRGRIEELLRTGRKDEVYGLRQQMYNTFGASFSPISLQLHDLLGSVMYDTGHPLEVLEETSYSLKIDADDITTLHRRALAHAELHDLPHALGAITKILEVDPGLATNTEIGGALGRLHRETWKLSGRRDDLQKAFEAYHAAAEANPSDYFCAINAAGLAAELKDTAKSNVLYQRVLDIAGQLRNRSTCSFWVDFSVGECLLALGRKDEALEAYQTSLTRSPLPSTAHKNSALKGAVATAARANVPEKDFAPISAILSA